MGPVCPTASALQGVSVFVWPATGGRSVMNVHQATTAIQIVLVSVPSLILQYY